MSFLRESLANSFCIIEQLIAEDKGDLVAEALLSIARDRYRFTANKVPKMRASDGLAEVGIVLSEDELALLDGIELSSRNRENYAEFVGTLDLSICLSVVEKLKPGVTL